MHEFNILKKGQEWSEIIDSKLKLDIKLLRYWHDRYQKTKQLPKTDLEEWSFDDIWNEYKKGIQEAESRNIKLDRHSLDDFKPFSDINVKVIKDGNKIRIFQIKDDISSQYEDIVKELESQNISYINLNGKIVKEGDKTILVV